MALTDENIVKKILLKSIARWFGVYD